MTAKKTSATEAKTVDQTSIDKILESMADTYSIAPEKVQTTLLNTAFKDVRKGGNFNEAEVRTILSVANKYDLNPFLREVYAFENKNGVIIPIIGVDGWIKILNRHENYEGCKFNYSDNMIEIGKSKPCYEWIEIEIYLSNRKFPVVVREYLDECYNGGKAWASPWDTHTKRFLRHKVISQGCRVAIGVNEACDIDEAGRIDDAIAAAIVPELERPETADGDTTATVTPEIIPETVEGEPKTEKKKPKPKKEKEVVTPEDSTLAKNAAAAGSPVKRKAEPEVPPETVEEVAEVKKVELTNNEEGSPIGDSDEIPPLF